MKKLHFSTVIFSIGVALSMPGIAQSPGVPIVQDVNPKQNAPLIAKAEKLREAGKLVLSIDIVKEQLKTPIPGKVDFPPAKKQPLPGRDIARAAREAHIQFGWYYRCKKCDHWHLNLAGAYAVAKDVIATCHHCVDPGNDMREGFLVAVDHRDEVLGVSSVLAKSGTLDGAFLRVEGASYSPLPLNDDVFPGDPAFCFSAPLGQSGYFSEGIVNRFYWRGAPGKAGARGEWKNLRVNVSTDWAPGSSGAAVLDQAGNAIGHVSTIHPLSEGPRPAPVADDGKEKKGRAQKTDRFGGATLITLHDATPARSMLELARPLIDFKPGDVVALEKPDVKPGDTGILKIGSLAPALKTGEWVQGEPVAAFEKGKVYVVEFWATWCGPCRATIPHLNELHKKFAEKGVVVIGQNVWEQDTAKVAPFINEMGAKMSYRVALDSVEGGEPNDGAMSTAWLKAAGRNGIPTAFLVDTKGIIAWIGHPAQLDEAIVESVLSGKFDIAKAKADGEASDKINDAMMRHGSAAMRAIKEQKWDAAAKAADELIAALPADKHHIAEALRFRIADGKKDSSAANGAAAKVSTAADAGYAVLNEIAWALVTSKNIEKPDLETAEKLARRSIEKSRGASKAAAMDTLARILFCCGKKEDAVKAQEAALGEATDEKLKAELTVTLEAYRKGQLPPAGES